MDWHAMVLLGAYHGINPGIGAYTYYLLRRLSPSVSALSASKG